MKLKLLYDKNFVELLKGSSISLIIKVLGMLFGYASMLFITNFYGADDWGLYSLCLTVLNIAILLPRFGLDNALVRIIGEIKAHNNAKLIRNVLYKAFIISVIISVLIMVFMNVFSETISLKLLNQSNMLPYIKWISFAIIPMVIITIISATFQAFKKVLLFMLFQTTLINALFLVLLTINYYMALDHRIFKIYLYSVCICAFVALIVLFINFKGQLGKTHKAVDKKVNYLNFKSIANISFPMMLSSSFVLLMGWSDILMLSYYKTTVDIGVYNSSLKLAALSGIVLIAINSIASPKFVEFYAKNDIIGLRDTVQKSTKMIFLTTTPILLILIFFSKSILGIFGDEFVVGYLALIYLCLSRFINAISGSVGYIMQMTDQQRTYQNVIIAAFIVNVILNFILIPIYSYTGAAIASSIAMVFWNIMLVIIIKKRLGFWTFYIPFLSKFN